MGYTLNENTVGIWSYETSKGNMMLILEEIEANKKYELHFRHRVYVDNKLFAESTDKREWVKATITDTRENALKRPPYYAAVCKEHYGEGDGSSWTLMNTEGIARFTEELMKMPGIHASSKKPVSGNTKKSKKGK